jgi:hypothetical protein
MIQDTRARRASVAARTALLAGALLALGLVATASRATATATATATPTPTPTPTPEIGAGIETTLPLRMQVGRFGEVQVFRPSGTPTAVPSAAALVGPSTARRSAIGSVNRPPPSCVQMSGAS